MFDEPCNNILYAFNSVSDKKMAKQNGVTLYRTKRKLANQPLNLSLRTEFPKEISHEYNQNSAFRYPAFDKLKSSEMHVLV